MANMEINYIINTIFFNTIQDGVLLEVGLIRSRVTCTTIFLLNWSVKTLTVTKGRWKGECFKQCTKYRLKYDNSNNNNNKKKALKSSQSP